MPPKTVDELENSLPTELPSTIKYRFFTEWWEKKQRLKNWSLQLADSLMVIVDIHDCFPPAIVIIKSESRSLEGVYSS